MTRRHRVGSDLERDGMKKAIVTEKDSVIKNIDFLQKCDKIIANHD